MAATLVRTSVSFLQKARFTPFLFLTLLIGLGGCSGGDDNLFTLVSLDGQTLPNSPNTSCCIWRSGSIKLDGADYRFVIRMSNKTGGGSFGGGAASTDEVFTSEEEGTFSLDGASMMLSRTFSSLPDVRLAEMRMEGDEISGAVTVDLSGGDERYEVVFRR